jgi:DNA-directed RNA polymerase subunit RPC12/RpoP
VIEFSCESCSKVLKTADDKAGLQARCPGCGAEVTVPDSPRREVVEVDAEDGLPAQRNKACPMCGEQVPAAAVTCKYCGEKITGKRKRSVLAPHRGVLILVFGILAWAVCIVFGPVAWFMGTADLKEMDAGRMDDEGRGLTQAGRIIGLVGCILQLVVIGLVALVFLIGAFTHM